MPQKLILLRRFRSALSNTRISAFTILVIIGLRTLSGWGVPPTTRRGPVARPQINLQSQVDFGLLIHVRTAPRARTAALTAILRCNEPSERTEQSRTHSPLILIVATFYLQHLVLMALSSQHIPHSVTIKASPPAQAATFAGPSWRLTKDNWEFAEQQWRFYFNSSTYSLAWQVKGRPVATVIRPPAGQPWRIFRMKSLGRGTRWFHAGWRRLEPGNFGSWSTRFFGRSDPFRKALQKDIWLAMSGRGPFGHGQVTKIILSGVNER